MEKDLENEYAEAEKFFSIKNYQNALIHFSHCEKAKYKELSCLKFIGLSYYHLGKFENALDKLSKVKLTSETPKEQISILLKIYKCCASKKLYDDFLFTLEKLKKNENILKGTKYRDYYISFFEAYKYWKIDIDLKKACSIYTTLENSPGITKYVSLVKEDISKKEKEIHDIENFCKGRYHPIQLLNLGKLYFEKGDSKKSIVFLNKCLEKEKEKIECYYYLFRNYSRQNLPEQAKETLMLSIPFCRVSEDYKKIIEIIQLLIKVGEYSISLDLINSKIENIKDNNNHKEAFELYFEKGRTFLYQKKYDLALQSFSIYNNLRNTLGSFSRKALRYIEECRKYVGAPERQLLTGISTSKRAQSREIFADQSSSLQEFQLRQSNSLVPIFDAPQPQSQIPFVSDFSSQSQSEYQDQSESQRYQIQNVTSSVDKEKKDESLLLSTGESIPQDSIPKV